MTKELAGQLFGWVLVTIAAWLIALGIMAYGLGSPWPWDWPSHARFYHIGLQSGLIALYAYGTRARGE